MLFRSPTTPPPPPSSSSGSGSGGSSVVVSSLSIVHVNALLSVLVTAVESLPWMDAIDVDTHSVFNKAVVNSGVWSALFTALHKASPFVQKHALKDINGVLVAANVGSATRTQR